MAKQVEATRLFKIKTVKILNERQVFLVSENYTLDRVSAEGSLILDRQHIEAETGQLKETKDARKPDEITLEIGEGCNVGTTREGSNLKLIKIQTNKAHIFTATFDETLFQRAGKKVHHIIEVTDYEK